MKACNQSQTRLRKAPAGAGRGSDVAPGQQSQQPFVTIQILEPSSREFCRFDLDRELFARMNALCQSQGITLAQLIVRAVDERIAQASQPGLEPSATAQPQNHSESMQKIQADAWSSILELEEAVMAACGLLSEQSVRLGDFIRNLDGDYGDFKATGTCIYSGMVEYRLRAASDGVADAVRLLKNSQGERSAA